MMRAEGHFKSQDVNGHGEASQAWNYLAWLSLAMLGEMYIVNDSTFRLEAIKNLKKQCRHAES